MRISDWSSDVCSSDLLSVTWWQNKSDTVAGQGIGFTPATNPVTGTSNSRFFNAPGLADHLAANFPTRASQADWAPEAGRSADAGRGAGLPGDLAEKNRCWGLRARLVQAQPDTGKFVRLTNYTEDRKQSSG